MWKIVVYKGWKGHNLASVLDQNALMIDPGTVIAEQIASFKRARDVARAYNEAQNAILYKIHNS